MSMYRADWLEDFTAAASALGQRHSITALLDCKQVLQLQISELQVSPVAPDIVADANRLLGSIARLIGRCQHLTSSQCAPALRLHEALLHDARALSSAAHVLRLRVANLRRDLHRQDDGTVSAPAELFVLPNRSAVSSAADLSAMSGADPDVAVDADAALVRDAVAAHATAKYLKAADSLLSLAERTAALATDLASACMLAVLHEAAVALLLGRGVRQFASLSSSRSSEMSPVPASVAAHSGSQSTWRRPLHALWAAVTLQWLLSSSAADAATPSNSSLGGILGSGSGSDSSSGSGAGVGGACDVDIALEYWRERVEWTERYGTTLGRSMDLWEAGPAEWLDIVALQPLRSVWQHSRALAAQLMRGRRGRMTSPARANLYVRGRAFSALSGAGGRDALHFQHYSGRSALDGRGSAASTAQPTPLASPARRRTHSRAGTAGSGMGASATFSFGEDVTRSLLQAVREEQALEEASLAAASVADGSVAADETQAEEDDRGSVLRDAAAQPAAVSAEDEEAAAAEAAEQSRRDAVFRAVAASGSVPPLEKSARLQALQTPLQHMLGSCRRLLRAMAAPADAATDAAADRHGRSAASYSRLVAASQELPAPQQLQQHAYNPADSVWAPGLARTHWHGGSRERLASAFGQNDSAATDAAALQGETSSSLDAAVDSMLHEHGREGAGPLFTGASGSPSLSASASVDGDSEAAADDEEACYEFLMSQRPQLSCEASGTLAFLRGALSSPANGEHASAVGIASQVDTPSNAAAEGVDLRRIAAAAAWGAAHGGVNAAHGADLAGAELHGAAPPSLAAALSTLDSCASALPKLASRVNSRLGMLGARSQLQRHWLRYTIVAGAVAGGAYYLTRAGNAQSLAAWARTASASVAAFADEHVVVPLRGMASELFSGHRDVVADRAGLADARASLAAMLSNFNKRLVSRPELLATLSPELQVALTSQVSSSAAATAAAAAATAGAGAAATAAAARLPPAAVGDSHPHASAAAAGSASAARAAPRPDALAASLDMRPVSERLVVEVQRPVRNAIAGDLIELLLINIAQIKEQSLSAMVEIDQILAEQKFNMQLTATLPAALLLFAGGSALRSVVRTAFAPADTADARERVRLLLRDVHRLLLVAAQRLRAPRAAAAAAAAARVTAARTAARAQAARAAAASAREALHAQQQQQQRAASAAAAEHGPSQAILRHSGASGRARARDIAAAAAAAAAAVATAAAAASSAALEAEARQASAVLWDDAAWLETAATLRSFPGFGGASGSDAAAAAATAAADADTSAVAADAAAAVVVAASDGQTPSAAGAAGAAEGASLVGSGTQSRSHGQGTPSMRLSQSLSRRMLRSSLLPGLGAGSTFGSTLNAGDAALQPLARLRAAAMRAAAAAAASGRQGVLASSIAWLTAFLAGGARSVCAFLYRAAIRGAAAVRTSGQRVRGLIALALPFAGPLALAPSPTAAGTSSDGAAAPNTTSNADGDVAAAAGGGATPEASSAGGLASRRPLLAPPHSLPLLLEAQAEPESEPPSADTSSTSHARAGAAAAPAPAAAAAAGAHGQDGLASSLTGQRVAALEREALLAEAAAASAASAAQAAARRASSDELFPGLRADQLGRLLVLLRRLSALFAQLRPSIDFRSWTRIAQDMHDMTAADSQLVLRTKTVERLMADRRWHA